MKYKVSESSHILNAVQHHLFAVHVSIWLCFIFHERDLLSKKLHVVILLKRNCQAGNRLVFNKVSFSFIVKLGFRLRDMLQNLIFIYQIVERKTLDERINKNNCKHYKKHSHL